MLKYIRKLLHRNDYEELMDENKNTNSRNEYKDFTRKSVPYYKLYRCATPLDLLYIFIGIICTIIIAICQPIYIVLFGDACGYFITYASYTSNTTISQEQKEYQAKKLTENIYFFAYTTGAVGVMNLFLQYIAGVLLSRSSLRQIFKIRQLFLQKTLYQDISWFDSHQSGDFATTFSENLLKIEEAIGEKLSLCLFYVVAGVAGITISLLMAWELTIVCVIFLPLASLLATGISLIGSKFSTKEMDSYASAGAIAEEVFTAIRTVVAFDGQKNEVRKYEKHLKDAKENNIRRNLFNGIGEGVLYFFMYAGSAMASWYSVRLIIEGRELGSSDEKYQPSVIVGIVYNSWVAYWNFYLAAPFIKIFGIACGAASKVFEVFDIEPEINFSLNSGLQLAKCTGSISFEEVHFRYPTRQDVKVLDGVTLTINPGETVAFVGTSGCGKSTCVQLIQRFYDATDGSILIDGINIRNLNLSWWRSQIGVVGQEPSLFALSIADNIRYGKLDATKDEIKKAAKKANVHDFIKSLPQGYDSIIGERGTQLSGGQKQRIAIARALVRKPSVLLLDEATSALDTTSEAEVQTAIESVRKECTTLIIAHRLSTVRNANRIVVFSGGHIVEQGSYQELIDTYGYFFNLMKMQVGDNGNRTLNDSPLISEKIERREFRKSSLNNELIEDGEEDGSKMLLSKPDRGPYKQELFELLKMNKPEWPWIILGSICSAIIGASIPLSTVVMANIIGDFYILNQNELLRYTNPQCVMLVVIGVVAGISYILQYYAFGLAGENLTLRVRSKMFSAMMNQEMAWFDRKDNGVGAICAKLSSDGAAIQAACGASVGIIMNALSTLIISNILSIYFQWELALIMALLIPVISIVTYIESSIVHGGSDNREKMLQKSAAIAAEAIGNIRTVASLGCEKNILDRYTKALEPYVSSRKKQSHVRAFQLGLARILMSYGYAVGFLVGTPMIINSHVTYKTITRVVDVQVQGSYAIGQAFAFFPNFQNGIEAAKRIFAILGRTPDIQNAPNATKSGWDVGDIEFSKVYFSYPTMPELSVLRGLDLTIFSDKTVALVGASGCGKSTIIQLLERFYDPTDGNVTIDDINIAVMGLQHLRANFGIVSQEPSLFDRTIAENIAYGNNHKIVSIEEIIEAAQSANIHDFISSLPLGYETRLGTKGAQLSGGQKQRIAIARALIRNPKVLLLDEATSALDTESEKVVQGALEKARQNRTCIIIAHRLSTVQDADLICVLRNGRIVEIGSHEELLAKEKYYYKFYKLQTGL